MTNSNPARRYDVMVTRKVASAIAWTGLGMRLTVASRATTGQSAQKLLDRAEDCYARATRCRLAR